MISEMQKLQALIVHYERQLHCPITRSQRVVIDKLLHHDFFEIGRSGMQFHKQQVIDALISETAEQPIQADHYGSQSYQSEQWNYSRAMLLRLKNGCWSRIAHWNGKHQMKCCPASRELTRFSD